MVLQRRFPHGKSSRGIFCSRTLSLRSITTIGYDMDYTLIHYNVHVRNSYLQLHHFWSRNLLTTLFGLNFSSACGAYSELIFDLLPYRPGKEGPMNME